MKTLQAFFLTLIGLLLLSAAFGAGYLFRAHQTSISAEFPVLSEAYKILEDHGLDPLPGPPRMEYGMIQGLVQAYNDPYTIFVEPVQHELESNALQGSFGGIGVQLERDAEGYVLLYPFPDSPAREAGIQDGDRLLQVESQPTPPEIDMAEVQSLVRGPVGTRVALTVGHAPEYAPVEVSVKRAEIPLPSVTWRLDPDDPRLGVIGVNLIAASTADEIQRGVKELQQQGATHFVLDLRDNPGGLLEAGVDVARLFLKQGTVMEQQYRGQGVQSYSVNKPGPLADLPLVVLINHNSASAAEIIAGALQAQGRAQLIGSPTFGKHTIQLVFDLQDQSSLHVTAARWWTPGLEGSKEGASLQPDIPIEAVEGESGPDRFLQAAAQSLLGVQ